VEDGTGSRETTLNLTLFGRQSLPRVGLKL
jgi:hypothetical protein